MDKSTTLSLTVKERLHIQNMQPVSGSMSTMRLSRQIIEKVKFLDEEAKVIGLSASVGKDGMVHYSWDDKKAESIEFVFTSQELKLLKECVDRLDKEGKVLLDQLDFFEKISGQEG